MKKKAFTLTELLIVVVIIGTLAAVVLPKFTKIVENHRTMEAENIMRAVRSEQEARCTLDRNYTANSADLSSWPSDLGNNYTYAFDATGMSASSRNKGYTLRMMSYADGGICCEGDDCADVGKYPSCTGFQYQANTACAAPVACQLKDEIQECGAGYTGIRGRRVTAACTYEEIDTCELITSSTGCTEGTTRNTSQTCSGTVGEECKGGEWKPFTTNTGGTPKPDDTTCESGASEACTYSCDTASGQWKPTCTSCAQCQEGAEEKVSFLNCSTEKWKRCNNGKWEEFTKNVTSTDCRQGCGTKPSDTQPCESGIGTQTREVTCNQSTGDWSAGEWTGECEECVETEEELDSADEDTCNGNKVDRYSCSDDSTSKTECIDIYQTSETPSGGNPRHCPYSCNKSCSSGYHCQCIPNVLGNGSIDYIESCVNDHHVPNGQTGVGSDPGIATETMVREVYRKVVCCPQSTASDPFWDPFGD